MDSLCLMQLMDGRKEFTELLIAKGAESVYEDKSGWEHRYMVLNVMKRSRPTPLSYLSPTVRFDECEIC